MRVPPRLPGKSHGKTRKISVLRSNREKKEKERERERGVESGNVKTCRRAALYRWSMQRESPLDKSNLFRFELSVTEGEGWRMSEGAARKSSPPPPCAPVNLAWSASGFASWLFALSHKFSSKLWHKKSPHRKRPAASALLLSSFFLRARYVARCTILHHYARNVKISVLTNLCSGKCFSRRHNIRHFVAH